MVEPENKIHKFRGGVWLGFTAATWPWGVLEVSSDQLVVIDESLKKEVSFTHEEIEKIEIKRYFPVIAYGICITPRDKMKRQLLYFWYISFRFKKLINALKQFNWL